MGENRHLGAVMNPKHFKDLLHATPFVPFALVMVTGKTYHVANPDILNVTMQGHVIYADVTGPTISINPTLIREVVVPAENAGT